MNMTVSTLSIWQRIRYFVKYNKKGLIICAMLAVLGVVLLESLTYSAPLYKTNMKLVKAMLKSIGDAGSVETIRKYMDSTEITSSVASVFNTFAGALQSVAVTLCVVLWLPTLITAYVNQQAYAEIVIKKFMILGISLALISNSTTVCNAIVGIGDDLMTKAGAAGPAHAAVDVSADIESILDDMYTKPYDQYKAEMEAEGSPGDDAEKDLESPDDSSIATKIMTKCFGWIPKFWYTYITRPVRTTATSLAMILVLTLPWIISRVGYVIIMIACYSRGLEIAVLTLLSPLPFAVIGNDPFGSGTSVRFMKNLGALAIQGVVMMAIATACTGLLGGQLEQLASVMTSDFEWSEVFSAGFDCAAITVAEAAMLVKSLSVSQKVLGLQ